MRKREKYWFCNIHILYYKMSIYITRMSIFLIFILYMNTYIHKYMNNTIIG